MIIRGPDLLGTVSAIQRHIRADRAQLQTFQDAKLRRLLVHAYEHVPYYRKLFDRQRLHPRHIRGTIDLELIPITTKQDLRDLPPSEIVTKGVDPCSLVSVRTNGSTGEPFVVRRTGVEQGFHTMFRQRAYEAFGLGLRGRIAAISYPRPRHPRDTKVVGRWLSAMGVHPTLRIDGLQDPEAIAEQLEAFQPDLITALPGMLHRVADHLVDSGKGRVRPRIVVVGGEVLTPLVRRRLIEAFGVAPLQTYASHEFQLLGWECRTLGGIHTCDDGAIVEVLNEGRRALPGEEGEVVATNLHAYAMPFIRYRLADLVTRGAETCACGQPFSVIGAIRGRMIDYFPLPNGRVVHPYQILQSLQPGDDTWIRQCQLLQDRPDRVIMSIVAAGAPAPELERRIVGSVQPLLGPGVEFQIRIVDEIPLEAGGKFRHARSLMASDYEAAPAIALNG
ncbi:MAG: phenylacetate--CoA ligase family protein [Gemmatimonadales bacterium]